MDSREERLARNEVLFRSVNERIEQIAAASGIDDHVFEFFCECSNVGCTLLIPMTVADYDEIRQDPRQFVVALGHELPEIEDLVERRENYQVVRKRGEAAEYVAERDPRDQR